MNLKANIDTLEMFFFLCALVTINAEFSQMFLDRLTLISVQQGEMAQTNILFQ